MNRLARIGLASVAVAVGLSALAAEKRPKALLIMLDGVRADAIANACTPNLDRLMAGKWRPGYTCGWSLAGQTAYDGHPDSAPNHASIATCACVAKHGVVRDMRTGRFDEWPIWLKRVTDADPSRRALFIYSWKPDELCTSDPRVRKIHGSDADNARALPKILAADDAPDATLYFVDLPDHWGHATRFGPSSMSYLNAVHLSDRYIGGVLDAIASRKTFDEEDWLIMVTADHGGYHFFHGCWAAQQANTIPVILAGRNVPSGELKGRPFHYDLTATALKHFGIDARALNLDGRMLTEVRKPQPKRALADGLRVYLPFDDKKPVNLVAGGPVPELFGTNVLCGVKSGYEMESGVIGGGLDFSGPASGLRLKGSENLEYENGSDFTVAVWVRNLDPKNVTPIFANKDLKDYANPGIALTTNNRLGERLGGRNRTGPGVCFNAAVPDARKRIDLGAHDGDGDRWTLYVVTHNGSDGLLTVYHGAPDGNLYWICEEAQGLSLKALPFHLGQDGTGAYPQTFRGGLDEFALWTRSLERDEVRAIYEAAHEGREILRDGISKR